MTNVNEVIRLIEKYTHTQIVEDKEVKTRFLKPEQVFIDDIGIGRGVTDRLKELGYAVNGISVGGKPKDPEKYKNIKAENYWLAQEWVKKADTRLIHDKDNRWHQMTWIKYKVSTDKVLQIEPKEDLKKRTSKSPDFAEAFMLTFSVADPTPNLTWL